ncbi:Wzz/FepE/Etk N-terminal domain-containing protein [Rheinheimera mangrovi]|uniref:Wzz/FepE/Etk N-terminal domain-containing protein n=1 Tax=Rheinheimera mangrovi TaxID=2498451 RepID=UPI000F8D5D13|nr:Wzz/FepE/Etk N-terminal domain-containing protein [Rheinheimera mangrovi]
MTEIKGLVAPEETDLKEYLVQILRYKYLIFGISISFALVVAIGSLFLPNVYRAETILAPVADNSALKVPGQLGSLAALAGVNLGGLDGGGKSVLALELLKSRDFIIRFIDQHKLLVPLMAAKGWDQNQDKVIIDADEYNEESKIWVRDVKAPIKPEPSMQEAYEEFKDIFAVSQDKMTSMVKISIEHVSPNVARDWVLLLTKDINNEMKQRDLIEAEQSIRYLNEQIAQTNISEIKTMLFSLVEEQTKTIMLANVRDEYVFKTIDPPLAPEKKIKPARALLVVLGFLLGFFLTAFFVIFRMSMRTEKSA